MGSGEKCLANPRLMLWLVAGGVRDRLIVAALVAEKRSGHQPASEKDREKYPSDRGNDHVKIEFTGHSQVQYRSSREDDGDGHDPAHHAEKLRLRLFGIMSRSRKEFLPQPAGEGQGAATA